MAKGSDNVFPRFLISEGGSTATPAAGRVTMYAKADGLMYSKDDAGVETLVSGGSASGIPATILDAKGDLIAATAADTAARLAVGADNDLVLAVASGASTGLEWQARSKFKYIVRNGQGDLTTTSTSKVAMDTTNLGFLTFTLAVGDVVRCKLVGMAYHATASARVGFDFEVDQPTSGNVFIAAGADYGVQQIFGSGIPYPVSAEGLFVATEAGSHGFRPAWLVSSATGTMANAASGTSDVTILFSAEKLGPVTA